MYTPSRIKGRAPNFGAGLDGRERTGDNFLVFFRTGDHFLRKNIGEKLDGRQIFARKPGRAAKNFFGGRARPKYLYVV